MLYCNALKLFFHNQQPCKPSVYRVLLFRLKIFLKIISKMFADLKRSATFASITAKQFQSQPNFYIK